MNNIDRNFKNKSMLRCMADGGRVENRGPMRAVDAMERGEDPNADRLKKGAEYGMKAAPAKKTEPTFLDKAKVAADKLRATIGFAEGGEVDGAGGPTDDKVPAMLSDGEYVLPADTVAHLGVENLDQLVSQTHKPTGKSPLRGGVPHAADGMFIPDTQVPPVRPGRMDPIEEQRRRLAARSANPSGAARPAPMATPEPLPQASEISRAEFDAARARAAGRVPVDLPASAPNTMGVDAAKAARAARYGEAAEVVAKKGALRGMAGAAGRAVGGFVGKLGAAGAALAATPTVFSTPTEDYDKRFGLDRNGPTDFAGLGNGHTIPGNILRHFGKDNAGQLMDDIGVRTVGAASDVANVATFGALGNVFADKQGAQDPALAGGQAPMIITGDNAAQIPQSALRLTPEQAAAQQANGGITPTSARTGDPNEVLGTFQGRAITRAMSDNMGGNVQATAPQEDPIEGALRNMLRQQGSGATVINSRASEINNQFDALQKQIVDAYGGKAQGTMITKLLDLQNARADALGQDQGARVNSQGNVVSADNSVRSQQSSALGDMAGMRNTDKTVGGSLLREQLQGIREADAAARAGIKDNRDTFMSDIQAQAPVDKEGQPLAGFRPDEIMARLAKTNPEVANMDRADRNQLIASTIASMQNTKGFNDSRGIFGTEDSTATPTGVYKDETNPMDIPAIMMGGTNTTSILRHMIPFVGNNDRVLNMGTDADGNPQLAYESDVMGDERFRQEVSKRSSRKQKDK